MPRRNGSKKTKAEKAKERYYLDLETKIVLKEGGKSKYVHLMSDGCIKKRYDSQVKEHEEHFLREIDILQHLAEWPHSPCILWINWKKMTIYMTYCGPNPDPDRNDAEQLIAKELPRLMQELRTDWRLFRLDMEDQVTDHIDLHNLCTNTNHGDDRLYLIDFGSPRWELRV